MDIEFVRKRITDLRLARDISEYRVSTDLGFSKGYLQSITSGRSLPSIQAFLDICNYFNITPEDFFHEDKEPDSPVLVQIMKNLKDLSEDDLNTVLEVTERYRYYRNQKGKNSKHCLYQKHVKDSSHTKT